ncbi:MAG TPA: Gldg family protein, partial [Saprospiraceae bacterium]|nr:Gldg family protein [Saprospiraceae bacterium]
MIKNTQFKILIAVLAFVAVNFVARKLFLRLDLTANHEYTLSQATRDVVRGLNDKMKIKAYFSDDIPIDI